MSHPLYRLQQSIVIAALAGPLPLLGGCQDVGAAPVGEMVVTVEPERPDSLELEGGSTVTLDGAWLAVETVEIEAASGDGGGGDSHGHDHGGGDDSETTAERGPIVATSPAIVDLLGDATEIHHEEHAPAASYEDLRVGFAPAGEGPAAGFALLVTGEVDDGTETRPFAVRWREGADGLVTDHAELALAPQQRRDVVLAVHLAELLHGLSVDAAIVEEGVVVFDSGTDPTTAERLRTNVAGAVKLEGAGAHDGHEEEGHDAHDG